MLLSTISLYTGSSITESIKHLALISSMSLSRLSTICLCSTSSEKTGPFYMDVLKCFVLSTLISDTVKIKNKDKTYGNILPMWWCHSLLLVWNGDFVCNANDSITPYEFVLAKEIPETPEIIQPIVIALGCYQNSIRRLNTVDITYVGHRTHKNQEEPELTASACWLAFMKLRCDM